MDQQRVPVRGVSGDRKAAFYAGTALTVVGLLFFLSVFFTVLDGGGASSFIRAPIGMALIVLGGFLRRAGMRGLAGSGLILDPERARDDLEPWARMAGGLVSDAFDESGLKRGGSRSDADGLITEAEFEREKQELLDAH